VLEHAEQNGARINLRGVTAPNLMDGLDKSLLGKRHAAEREGDIQRVGCGNSVLRGHRDLVLVDEAAEKVASVHAGQWRRRVASGHRDTEWFGRLEVERAVRPSVVVMAYVDAEDVLEVAAAGDQEPVETFSADASDPALDVRVRVRRSDRRADDPADACAREDGIERRGELLSRSCTRKRTWAAAIVEAHQ
jgi:hypothetical protein